jgi:hypothetical protein
MFRTSLAAIAAILLSLPASAATLSSGTAFFEQGVTVGNGQPLAANLPVTDTTNATLQVAQFDAVFGSLTQVDLVFDITSAMQVLIDKNSGTRFLDYESDLSATIGTSTTAVLDYEYTTFASNPNGFINLSGFNRSLARLTLNSAADLALFTGTGTASVGLTATQTLSAGLGTSLIDLFGFGQPIMDQVSSISVEYSFTPGVQTVETQLGLVSFSTAFVPEVILEQNNLSAVPLPASGILLLGVLAFGGVSAARRKNANT